MVLLQALQGHAGTEGAKLYPVDEATRDPELHAFRDNLLAAAKRHDTDFLMGILAPDIQSSFGDGAGREGFRKHWQLDRSGSTVWEILVTVLSLGGSFGESDGGQEFCAPYVFARFPEELDAYEYAAITGSGVNVRRHPAASASVIGTLSYDVVKVLERPPAQTNRGAPGEAWVKVVMPPGGQGFVARKFVRSPLDYRACFRRTNGQWQMTALIAGD